MEKLPLRGYFGYAIADLGNNISFSATSTYLTLFYTDVLGKHFDAATGAKWLIAITVIMIIARIWDAVNDPIMGFLVQRAKPSKAGKFRPYLIYGGIPLAFIVVLMFLPIPNMSLAGCIAFALITYIAYDMIYTIVLVPYGSLATVMTRKQNERSRLSIARSIGGGIGGIPTGLLFPILVYTTTVNANGEKITTLDGNKLLIAMVVIAAIMIISYTTAFFTIKEYHPYPQETQKVNIRDTVKSLIHNKVFVIMCLVGLLLIASSMFMGTVNIYLFNIYFQRPEFMAFISIATYAPMAMMIPFTGKIIKTIGKKNMCVYSLVLVTVATFFMAVLKITNPWVYLCFCFLQGCGLAFLTLEIWAIAMDAIDYQEVLTKKREEAACYSIFTFTRKIGQAIAAIVPALLDSVGYVAENGYAGQSADTVSGIYTIATVVPLIMFAAMLVLMTQYPLNKSKDAEMREQLAIQRAAYES